MRKILLSLFFLGWLLPVNALPVSKNSDTFLETDSAGYRSYRLDEVTVISNPKAYAKLFEFPGSITYLSERNIEELNLRSVKDISTVAPNLFIPDYGSKLISSAYIRGIGSRINSPAVGLNVNNIPYLDKSAFDFDFLEIDRIEILRGPQGTLYGRNTMAGLINIYTKSPFDYQGTKIMLGGGNYSAMGISAFTSRKINGKMAFSSWCPGIAAMMVILLINIMINLLVIRKWEEPNSNSSGGRISGVNWRLILTLNPAIRKDILIIFTIKRRENGGI